MLVQIVAAIALVCFFIILVQVAFKIYRNYAGPTTKESENSRSIYNFADRLGHTDNSPNKSNISSSDDNGNDV